MKIQDLLKIYAQSPQVKALGDTLKKKSVKTVFLEGLMCSSAPVVFAAIGEKGVSKTKFLTTLFVMQDADDAGYFYHDLVQMLGEEQVLFFPSSYRRAIKYGQRDAANEILRTEVLSKLSTYGGQSPEQIGDSPSVIQSQMLLAHSGDSPRGQSPLFIVSYPEALAELVVSKKQLSDKTLVLRKGETISVDDVTDFLRELGFHEVDYVYEPGQFALRGSILDIYSFSSELPFRIDLFGDDIDSIRTFEVDTQLSKSMREQVEIVPELSVVEEKMPLLSFLPDDVLLVAKDFQYVQDVVERTYQEGFSQQALTERLESATEMEEKEVRMEMQREMQLVSGAQFSSDIQRFRRVEMGSRPSFTPDATLSFHIAPQPQFHKNFELLQQSLEQYLADGYQLYILADSGKQLERLKDIFAEMGGDVGGKTSNHKEGPIRITFEPIQKTLHAGFVDSDRKLCVFTDHQIFDRFHKYNLRSDKARGGKVALTLKEIQQFEPGDYVVHIDHGIGRFGGLVRMPQGDGYQEMIKIQYDGGGTIYVSIHSLYKVSKYKAQDGGDPPRLSHLGTGQWERMKERTKQKLKDIARDLIRTT